MLDKLRKILRNDENFLVFFLTTLVSLLLYTLLIYRGVRLPKVFGGVIMISVVAAVAWANYLNFIRRN